MGTHVTLLVHGIGEQVAGETVDEFVGAARHELNLDSAVVDHTVLLSEEEGTLPEAHQKCKQLHQYPCQMRRLKRGDDDLLFAEVHWADLSAAPNGLFATVFDLLRLILGLGYLALDNVENNGGSGWGLIRCLVHIFVWIFFLILAPINALMFVGSLGVLAEAGGVSFGSGEGEWSPTFLLFFLGAVLTSFAGWSALRADTYLKRLFFSGTAILGIMALLVSFGAWAGIHLPVNDNWVPTCMADQALRAGVPPSINCFAGVLIFWLNSVWLLEVGIFVLLCILSLWSKNILVVEKRSIYLAICAAMLLFWMTFASAFWSVFRSAVLRIDGDGQSILLTRVIDEHFDEATATLSYVVFAVLIIFSVILGVFLLRKWTKCKFDKRTTREGKLSVEFSRLILNPAINTALVFSSLLLVLGAFYAVAEWWLVAGRTNLDILKIPANFFVWHVGSTADYLRSFSGVALTIVAGIGLLIVNNSRFIAAVLGVGRDIVIYATRSHLDSPSKAISRVRTLRQRLFGSSARPSQYIHRERIEARFRQTFMRVLAQERNVEKVTIVSHSQGTVVSVMGLLRLGQSGGQSAHNFLKKLTLVTMGCPLQHIYRHYFHENYEVASADWHNKENWLNIYRVDDFVGKTVAGAGLEVTDEPVLAAKGHSHYWSDQLVWDILKAKKIY